MSDFRAIAVDRDGFVMDPAAVQKWIDSAVDDESEDAPDSIRLVTASAMPTPQYEGSDIERCPGSYLTTDLIAEWDVSYVGYADIADRWTMACRIADLLNAHPS